MNFLPPTPDPRRPVYTGDADDGRRVPPHWLDQAPVTRALLALNIAVFFVQAILTRGASFAHLPSREALAFGASSSFAIVGENRWETLVTACFLHDGILHIGFNMLALWMAGPLVERAVGSARMAPMYLLAGAFGNAISAAYSWLERSAVATVGASGAIAGLVAAAFVVGWRVQGWRGPLTQAMVRWLGLMVVFGVVSRTSGGNVDNAAHVGGALAGAGIAAMWRRGTSYSQRMTNAMLGASGVVVVACIAIVAVHDRLDRFAVLNAQDRQDYTLQALRDGRCGDAHEGLRAVERLRARMAPVRSLRAVVEATCGHGD